jgi:2-C-methyl-D-erythritol 4-phosphate cytidylyltransferase
MTVPIIAIILAAGASLRMGGIKKEYQKLKDNNLTVLGAAVSVFAAIPSVKTIVIAVPASEETAAREALPPELLKNGLLLFVNGGDTRRASVFNALCVLDSRSPCYVLIHDGARPWVNTTLIKNIITAVKKYDAVIPLLAVTDTPKECETPLSGNEQSVVFIKNHLKRAATGFAQTPQAFKFPEILYAHEKAAQTCNEEFTDDAEIWGRFCGKVAVIPGEQENRKITFKEDLEISG